MIEQDFLVQNYKNIISKGVVKWQSPSNIALVKYWGKRDVQIPENPSISFTLSNCKTITELSYIKKETEDFSFDVFLDGEKNTAFKPKIETFFKRIIDYVPFLKEFHFTIKTSNTFPHSSGIASSASGMSVLALCILSLEEKILGIKHSKNYFINKASFLARLGSGSACRSIEGELVVWGEHKEITGSSNLYGVKFEEEVHTNFKNYRDTILLVDKGEKQVSSTLGHKLMYNHPYAKNRFNQAHDNLSKLKGILKSGDLDEFIKIVESEALTLHAMMMTSMPYFILMKPNTLEIINKIWEYREATNSKLCFTLDAGANVHLLYPEFENEEVLTFIKDELIKYCQNEQFIEDQIGKGASEITF